MGPAEIRTWGVPPGYTSSADGANTASAPAASAVFRSDSRVRG